MHRPLHKDPGIVIPYLLSMAVALFWPEEGWRIPALDAVADFFVAHIPSVRAYVEKSVYPEVMRAYFALTFFIFILTSWSVMRNKYVLFGRSPEEQLKKVKASRFPRLIVFIGLVYPVFLVFGCYIQNGYQFNLLPMLERRWALAVLGPIVGWFSVHLFLAVTMCYLEFFWKLTLKKGV